MGSSDGKRLCLPPDGQNVASLPDVAMLLRRVGARAPERLVCLHILSSLGVAYW